jgi:hypothetical protein
MSANDPRRTYRVPAPDAMSHSGSRFEPEDTLPIVLHADDDPAVLLGLVVECLGECADLCVGKALGGTIGIFALGIVVEHEHFQPQAVAGPGIFQHLLVAGGVAKRGDGPTPDLEVNALRLASIVVVEEQLRLLDQDGLAILVIADSTASSR